MGIRRAIKKIPRWAIVSIGIFLLLVLTATIGLNIYLNNLVNSRLPEMVRQSSGGLYRLEYSDISMDPFSGNITIHQAELIPDTVVFTRLRQLRRAPRFLVAGKTKKLSLKNVRWMAYMNNKNLKIGKLLLEQPEFNLVQYRQLDQDTANEAQSAYQFISKNVKDFKLGLFNIKDAVIHYQVADTAVGQRTINTIEHLDVGFTRVHLAGDNDTNRYLAADEYYIDLKEYKHRTSDSLYWLGIKGFKYNSRLRKASLESFYSEPRYSEANFSKQLGHQETRYETIVHNITAEGFDIAALLARGEVRIRKMNIQSGSANFYMNRAYPLPPEDNKNVVISQRILNLDMPMLVESFNLKDFKLTYKEYNPRSGRVAILQFDNISGKAGNITNLPAIIAQDPQMKVNISARFLGGSVKSELAFALDRTDGMFTASLEVNEVPAERLNSVLTPMALIEVKEGILQKLEATITGTANRATADVKLQYEDLKINMLENNGQGLEKKRLKSIFANILIFDDNPKDGALRTARQVQGSRKFARSFFNLAWSTVAAGIIQIIFKEKDIRLQS